MHRIEVDVMTGEVKYIPLTPEEIAAIETEQQTEQGE